MKSTTISVTPGTKVKLEANPKTGFVLKNWVISGTSTVADGIGSDGSFTPTASGNYNFTAVYVESLTFEAYVRTYDGASLSENTNGGSVEIKCGNQNSTVDSNDGTHITLNAVKGSTVTYYAKLKTDMFLTAGTQMQTVRPAWRIQVINMNWLMLRPPRSCMRNSKLILIL